MQRHVKSSSTITDRMRVNFCFRSLFHRNTRKGVSQLLIKLCVIHGTPVCHCGKDDFMSLYELTLLETRFHMLNHSRVVSDPAVWIVRLQQGVQYTFLEGYKHLPASKESCVSSVPSTTQEWPFSSSFPHFRRHTSDISRGACDDDRTICAEQLVGTVLRIYSTDC